MNEDFTIKINVQGLGEVSATPAALLIIANAFHAASNAFYDAGCTATGNRKFAIAKHIYNELAERGYYKE